MGRPNGRIDIYILGLGMRGASQVTWETEQALRRCRRAYSVIPIPEMRRYLRTLCPYVIDLRHLYAEGQGRRKTYEAMAEAVLAGAAKSSPVALVLYGHPLVCSAPSRILLERAHQLRLAARLLPAVSSLDCLFADLQLDPGQDGLQMYEVNDLLLRKRPLQADVSCLLLQPGVVESRLHWAAPSRRGRFQRLKDYLLRYYPPEHEVIVARCRMGRDYPADLRRIPIGRLERAHDAIDFTATLFIPPARRRPVKDRALEGLLASVQHVRSLTLPPR